MTGSFGQLIIVVDIKDAYPVLSIQPDDRPMQGIKWDFDRGAELFLDNRLCMGLSSSPFIFTQISNFVARCGAR